MKEPSSWFREETTRKPTELEVAANWSVGKYSKGKLISFNCTLLKQECKYNSTTGTGDCRTCNFALVYLMANPEIAKQFGKG